VEDKYKLLKPILSRFCEIYVPEPEYNGAQINLYKYNIGETFKLKDVKKKRIDALKKELNKIDAKTCVAPTLLTISAQLYEKGYNALDLIQILEESDNFFKITEEKKYELLIAFNKVRKEFRNEKLIMLFILNFVFISLNSSLENISFM
jgi:hypothetical protein